MASRSLEDLKKETKKKAEAFLELCRKNDLEVLVYCTLRPPEEQARLYRQSRSRDQIRAKAAELKNEWGRPDLAELLISVGPQEGPLVTYAGPGQSMHQYGLAFDAVPCRGGKPVWGTRRDEDHRMWDLFGQFGVKAGLEWAGEWTRFIEFPHLQEPGAQWQELIKS